MQTATVEAANWWARSRGAQADHWIGNYQRSTQSRHRSAIVQALAPLQPETLFELGAHCGPNLVRLAKEFPALRMIGVDISPEAITAGQRWVGSLGLSGRIQLNQGRFPDATSAVPSGAFDVVLSCYALAYMSPADLGAALYEVGRLATRAIVLAEPLSRPDGSEVRSLSGYTEWAHDYEQACQWVATCRGLTWTRVPIEPAVDKLTAVLVGTR